MEMKERGKGKEPQKAQEKRGQEKGEELGKELKMGCVPCCENALLATIDLPPKNVFAPFGLPTQKSWYRH